MMRILIIEDERSSAERLRRLIEGFGPEYKIAASVESNAEARAFFQAGRPQVDLILSDIQLGDGLSFEALREAPASIPVIFTTAFDHYAVQAFKFNSIDYLLKPVDGQELRDALERVYRQQNLQRPADAQVVVNHQYFSNYRSHCQISIIRPRTSQIPFYATQYSQFQSLTEFTVPVKP